MSARTFCFATLVSTLTMAGVPDTPALAQASRAEQPPARAQRTELDDLRKVLDEQRALIARQADHIARQGAAIEALQKRVEDIGSVALAARNEAADLKKEPQAPEIPQALEARLAAVEQSVKRAPELLDQAVTAGEFPGSIRVPGTDANLKLGGTARLAMVQSLGPLGADDRFITSSIPVGDQQAGQDSRTTYTAKFSRFNLDFRTPTRVGVARLFLESDFATSGNGARLRHAFVQTPHWIAGQTWSTFSDPEAEPIGIDFEGLNAISLFRQAQIRYTRQLASQLSFSAALENPAPDLTGAQGVNLTPDFVTRVRWEPGDRMRSGPLSKLGHVQVAFLVRALRGQVADQPDLTLSTGGFGLDVSGVLVPKWDHDDRVKFATNNGWGIGKYIADLGTLGGQDAVFDPTTNDLRALPVTSAYFGYERMWKPTFSSTFTYGIVNVSNLDIQLADALRRTQRTSFNITWTPIAQMDLVLEFLTGTRVNKDGERGASSQIQGGWIFRF